MVCEAIRRTKVQGKTSVRYIATILQNWRDQGVLSLADVGRADQEFAQRKQARDRGKPPPGQLPLPPGNDLKRSMIRDLYQN